MVDVVSGGFPCQPFSVAGKRKASDDSRDMWPATMDVIKAVKPRVVFLENVPGLLSATVDDESGRPIHYFGAILRDLAEGGYDVKWCVLGADDVGARHHRKRLWILAHSKSERVRRRQRDIYQENGRQDGPLREQLISSGKKSKDMADTKSYGLKSNEPKSGNRLQPKNGQGESEVRSGERALLSNSVCTRLERNEQESNTKRHSRLCDRIGNDQIKDILQGRSGYWDVEPRLGRVANGVADRSNRLKAIGNGQVSLTMATVYEILSREFLQ